MMPFVWVLVCWLCGFCLLYVCGLFRLLLLGVFGLCSLVLILFWFCRLFWVVAYCLLLVCICCCVGLCDCASVLGRCLLCFLFIACFEGLVWLSL